MTRQLNVLSLFSGVGGIDLGLERAGLKVVGQVEIDPWARTVLAKHWPDVPQHDDVRTVVDWWNTDGKYPRQEHPGNAGVMPTEATTIDVIAGGFPRSMPRHIECGAT